MANRVLPILRLAVLCERIELDPENRPRLGLPVHTIQFPPGITRNYQLPLLHVYAQLQEWAGSFMLKVVLRKERGDIDLYTSDPVPIEPQALTHQNVPMEIDLVLEDLVIPAPGHYELWVYANHVNLHNPDQQPGWPFPPMRLTVFGPDGIKGGAV